MVSRELTGDDGRDGPGAGPGPGPAESGTEGGLDGEVFVRWLRLAADEVERAADRLTELDSAIGDADHGGNMRRGFQAVREGLAEDGPRSPGAVLTTAGRTLVSTVGGASGPLYGTLLRRAGKALGDAERVPGAELARALRAGVDAVAQLGGAAPGDKTMLDALVPAVDALEKSGGTDFGAARTAAEEGAAATEPLQARKGRASYLGERSIGHRDPGATSSALLIAALDRAVYGDTEGDD